MKRFLATILIAATALATAHGAFAEDKLRIATEGAYPPFNQLDPDGSLSGFDVDIAYVESCTETAEQISRSN